MRYTDIDTPHGDQVEVTALDEAVVLGLAEAFAGGLAARGHATEAGA